jgi:hypothetical protein
MKSPSAKYIPPKFIIFGLEETVPPLKTSETV